MKHNPIISRMSDVLLTLLLFYLLFPSYSFNQYIYVCVCVYLCCEIHVLCTNWLVNGPTRLRWVKPSPTNHQPPSFGRPRILHCHWAYVPSKRRTHNYLTIFSGICNPLIPYTPSYYIEESLIIT